MNRNQPGKGRACPIGGQFLQAGNGVVTPQGQNQLTFVRPPCAGIECEWWSDSQGMCSVRALVVHLDHISKGD